MKCNQCKCLDCLSPHTPRTHAFLSNFQGIAVKVPDMQNRINHFQFWRHIDLINLRASLRDNLIDNPRSSVCPSVPLSLCPPVPSSPCPFVHSPISQSVTQSVSRFTRLSSLPRVCCCLHTTWAGLSWGFLTPLWYPLWELGKIGLILLQMSQCRRASTVENRLPTMCSVLFAVSLRKITCIRFFL